MRKGLPRVRPGSPAMLFAIVAVLSAPVFCTRYLNDMEYYTLVANKLLRGGILYRDAIDTKPPLVFLHYASIFRAFGPENVNAVKIVTTVWLALSALALRLVYKELFPRAQNPDLAPLLFVLASFSGWGEDFLSSNTEILSNLFVLVGVACLVKDDFSSRSGRLVLGGAAIGVAFLYRYQAGAALGAYVLTLTLTRRSLASLVSRFLAAGAGFLVPIGVFAGYYIVIDGWSDLAFFLRYQSYYLRPHSLYWPQVLLNVAIVVMSQAPFLVLAGSQLTRMAARRTLTEAEWFLVSFLGWSVLPFFLGGHYFPHYFVQAIPPLTLLAAERLSQPEVAPSPGVGAFYARHARSFIAANVAVFSAVNVLYYSLRPTERASPAMTEFVRLHTSPNDTVFVWAWRSQLLLDFDRVYATRFLSNEFLIGRLYGTPYRRPTATAESARPAAIPELWPILLKDLQARPPRVIVDDMPDRSNFTIEHYAALSAFVGEHYEQARLIDGLRFYLRRAADSSD